MSLITAIENIYLNLHYGSDGSISSKLKAKQAFAYIKNSAEGDIKYADVYYDLGREIINLHSDSVPPYFIERYCLSKLTALVLSEYDINIGAALMIAIIMLYGGSLPIIVMFNKANTSGLILPTVLISDIDAISDKIFESLKDQKLLAVTRDNRVILGLEFKIKPNLL